MKYLWGILLLFVCINVDNPSRSFSVSDVQCLAAVVEHEASGESLAGRRAVLDVLQERMRRSGKSCPVVALAPAQFSHFSWKQIYATKSLTSFHEVFRMAPQCPKCSHFARVDVEEQRWMKEFKYIKTVGMHRFYKEEI